MKWEKKQRLVRAIRTYPTAVLEAILLEMLGKTKALETLARLMGNEPNMKIMGNLIT